jgi:hypothetical protein
VSRSSLGTFAPAASRPIKTASRFAAVCLCLALAACSSRGEVDTLTVAAFSIALRGPGEDPVRGKWGDELKPGIKAVAVSPDLVARGLSQGTRVRIEGLPSAYRVRDQLPDGTRERIEIFMGTDAASVARFGEQRMRVWWETP